MLAYGLIFLSVMMLIDRLVHLVLARCLPDPSAKTSLPVDVYPRVAIQLPMFNEGACFERVIDACCQMDWPRDKLFVQVLDDSTDMSIRRAVAEKIQRMREAGVAIELLHRLDRKGYKAGAMREGMKRLREDATDYVAIFDADFIPEPNWLKQTVPHLLANPEAAFVQTRWTYTNADANLFTRLQEVHLNYHFQVEQQSRYKCGLYFNFNGTAGIWRMAAIEDAGNWESDTVVEDMDLSIRAYCKGWGAVYLNDVECRSELPQTNAAFRTQQYRWHSGPMQVLRKVLGIIAESRLSAPKKIYCYWFFTRYIAIGLITVCGMLFGLLAPHLDLAAASAAWIAIALVEPIAEGLIEPRFYTRLLPCAAWTMGARFLLMMAKVGGLLNLARSRSWVVTVKLGGKASGALAEAEKSVFYGEILAALSISLAVGLGWRSAGVPSRIFAGCLVLGLLAHGLGDWLCAFTDQDRA